MTSSVWAATAAGVRARAVLRALVLGWLTTVFVPSPAEAQPLLPQSSVRYLAGPPRSLVKPAPSGAIYDVQGPPDSDPYPGTRRADEIQRVPEFAADVVGWVALGRVLWSSGYDQVAKSPKSWPRTSESYGRRFATRSAQLVTIEAVRHGVASALHRDPAYVRCACTGFRARLGHVAKSVLTDFDETGVRRVGWPRFAGAMAGSFMLGRLQPGQGGAGTVAYRAATTVAGSFVGAAVKEIGLFGKAKPQPPSER